MREFGESGVDAVIGPRRPAWRRSRPEAQACFIRFAVDRTPRPFGFLVAVRAASVLSSSLNSVDVVHELLATTAALEKLGARTISIEDAQQLLRNRHLIVRNPGRRRRTGQARARRLIIGRTDGGRTLTLVVERTAEPTVWLIVTGWDASDRERKILEEVE